MKQTNLRKSDIILHTLNPYDPEMQRYLSLSKRIEQLMNNAEDENDPCVPVELMAEFFVHAEYESTGIARKVSDRLIHEHNRYL